MSQRVDLSSYFTRRQSDARFLRAPQDPLPPKALAVSATGLSTTGQDNYAWIDLTVTDPDQPTNWYTGTDPYVSGYSFEVTYSLATGEPVTRTIFLTHDSTYRIQPVPAGMSVTIACYLVDYQGVRSTRALTLTTRAALDAIPPTPPVVIGFAINPGAQIILTSPPNTEGDFASYELWRGVSGVDLGTKPLLTFSGFSITDIAIPSTGNYYYQVIARDYSGNGAASNVIGPLSLNSTGASAPVGVDNTLLTATPQSNGTVTLAWPADTGVAGYRVWRKKQNLDGTWPTSWSYVTASNITSYVDADLSPSLVYRWAVTSFNSSNDESSFPAAFASATVLYPPVPASPSGIIVTGRDGGIGISWNPVPGAASYSVSYELTGAGPWADALTWTSNQAVIYGLTNLRTALANQMQLSVIANDAYGQVSAAAVYLVTFTDLNGYTPGDGIAPAPVSALVSVASGDGMGDLSWTASPSADVIAYRVSVHDTYFGLWVMWSTGPGLSARITGLEPNKIRNQSYWFQVEAIDASGRISSAVQQGPLTIVDNTAPAVPANMQLAATGVLGGTQISWANPTGSDFAQAQLIVTRTIIDAGGQAGLISPQVFQLALKNDGSLNSFIDQDPDEGYRVRTSYVGYILDKWGNAGINAAAITAESLTANDLRDGVAPSVPTNLSVLDKNVEYASDGSVFAWANLGWTSVPDTDLDRYELKWWQYDLVSGNPISNPSYQMIAAGATQFLLRSLLPGASYQFQLRSFDHDGNASPYTIVASSTMQTDTGTPASPASVKLTGATGGILLAWSKSTTPGVTTYRVSIPAISGVSAQVLSVTGNSQFVLLSGGPSKTQIKDPGFYASVTVESLSPGGVAYSPVTVCAAPADNDLLAYLPVDTIPPDDPTAVTVSYNQRGQIVLGWTAPTAIDVRNYDIVLQYENTTDGLTGDGTYSSSVWCATVPAPTTSARIQGLTAYVDSARKYRFFVRAIDNSGLTSNYVECTAGPVTVLGDSTPPSVPTGLAVSMSSQTSGSVTRAVASVIWTPNSETDVFGYEVAYGISGSGQFTNVQVLQRLNSSLQLPGLLMGTSYDFKVRAFDITANFSSFSGVVTSGSASAPAPGNTAPPAPTLSSTSYSTSLQQSTVNFTPATNPEADTSYYSIRRSSTSGTEGPEVGTASASPFHESMPQSSSSSVVYYTVRTVDTGGLISGASSQVPLTIPATSNPPPDRTCPTPDMYVLEGLQAGDAKVGDLLDCFDPLTGAQFRSPVLDIERSFKPVIQLSTEDGWELEVSEETPMVLPDGSIIWAYQMHGMPIARPTSGGSVEWVPCRVTKMGLKEVVHLIMGGKVFAAGRKASQRLFSHNFSLPVKS